MPRLLLDRLTSDSVEQFLRAARQRFEEAWELARGERRTAAIYLWGYVAEMTLKAGWFGLLGFSAYQPITAGDLKRAVELAEKSYGIAWHRQARYHAIWHWAQLLTTHRRHLKGAYRDPGFPAAVLGHSERVSQIWREFLRYKPNRAYPFEVRAMAESAHWLLYHVDQLAN